ncbi:aminotransferase class V-fold PLP-dependent enzyme [Candidatus Woesearchaeota archaeon]|nr:aminotransferase class V-fold PLP-dependent enzyme [Candidatus Woesearchaeota archaeon]
MTQQVYLDNAAASPLAAQVRQAIHKAEERYGNPSSLHNTGQQARQLISDARQRIAALLHCEPEEVFFTSGGTESINTALQGVAREAQQGHIITVQTEHAAVLETCKYLSSQGFRITYLPVDYKGQVRLEDLKNAISKDTILFSYSAVNNETGSTQEYAKIAELCRKQKIPIHIDASQYGEPFDTRHADLVSMSGSKVHGPKGTGLLFVQIGTPVQPLLFGGGQELQLRSGTENVPGIAGLAEALTLSPAHKKHSITAAQRLRKELLQLDGVTQNGGSPQSSIINIRINGVEGETLVKHCNTKGLYISAGSACHSGHLRASHVLTAMGLTKEQALSSVRLSTSYLTTPEDIIRAKTIMQQVIAQLRELNNTVHTHTI